MTPPDRALDELRSAYFAVPAGSPTDEQITGAMPRLLAAVEQVLRINDRICDICGADHHAEDPREVIHDDIAAVLRELELGDHARPVSTHAVVHDEILPTIRRLREAVYDR
jgi:hypothetical protein